MRFKPKTNARTKKFLRKQKKRFERELIVSAHIGDKPLVQRTSCQEMFMHMLDGCRNLNIDRGWKNYIRIPRKLFQFFNL